MNSLATAPSRTFYRIVQSNPPTLADFTSYQGQGKPLLDDEPEKVMMWSGISVWNTEIQARNKARDLPWLGQYIATVVLSASDLIAYQKTNGRGHFTLWGDPQAILDCVTTVVSVE